MKGELVLVILDGERDQRGIYEGADEHFIYLKTNQQTILIPHARVIKIKVDNGRQPHGR